MKFIHEIVGAFPKESCINMIDFFENNINLSKPGVAGTVGLLDDLEISLSLDFKNPNNFGLEYTLCNAIKEYKNIFPLIDSHIGDWNIFPHYQFMKYEPNKYYERIHCENDGASRNFSRVFGWMVYLNDIKDGGGTHFVYQNFTTKPVAGNLYIWPAGWTHMHHGVNAPKEVKYILTGWVNYIDN